MRPSEIAHAQLGDLEYDANGGPWRNVVGKGSKSGKVGLPLLATGALDRYPAHRGLPVVLATALIENLSDEGVGITASRLGVTMRRFFLYRAKKLWM